MLYITGREFTFNLSFGHILPSPSFFFLCWRFSFIFSFPRFSWQDTQMHWELGNWWKTSWVWRRKEEWNLKNWLSLFKWKKKLKQNPFWWFNNYSSQFRWKVLIEFCLHFCCYLLSLLSVFSVSQNHLFLSNVYNLIWSLWFQLQYEFESKSWKSLRWECGETGGTVESVSKSFLMWCANVSF